jgi:multiple sugar transport system substrate-binding protein
VAACGPARDEPAVPPATGPVALLYWRAFAEAHLQARSMQTVIDDYVARNPGRVTVEVGEGGGAVAMDKIKAAVAANTPPHLWGPQQLQAAELFALGALADLNVELRRHREWGKLRGEIVPALLDGASWKGKLTMMPLNSPIQLIGYNKQHLLKAGVALPKAGHTWSDFEDIGRRAAQPPDRVLFDFTYVWTAFVWWTYSNGQRLLNADRTKAQFDAPGAQETLQWLHDQVTKGMARNGPPDFDQGKSITDTINANAVTGPRFPNVDPGDGSGIHTIHYPLGPGNSKKELISYSNTYGPAVFRSPDASRVAAAAEIAAWAARADVQAKMVAVSLTPPANTVAARDENLPRQVRENPILKAINDGVKFALPTPNFPSWNAATVVLNEELQRLAKGELRPRDALASAQRRIQALFDEDLRRG